MGTHARPRHGLDGISGRHRGEPEPLLDLGDLGATALRTGAVLATGTAIVAAGAGGAIAATQGATGADSTAHAADATSGGATAADFAALRQCESSDNYAANTHNGYYGAYQFDPGTWHGLGYAGLPSAASPATQDQAAERLQAARGWEPWPGCSAKLGLGVTAPLSARASLATTVAAPVRHASARRVASAARTSSVHLGGGVPAFPGTTLSAKLVDTRRTDVMIWQSRMVRRGWHLQVDGYFGPQSASIAGQFAAEKGITAPHGEVTAAMWTAAWTAPITD